MKTPLNTKHGLFVEGVDEYVVLSLENYPYFQISEEVGKLDAKLSGSQDV